MESKEPDLPAETDLSSKSIPFEDINDDLVVETTTSGSSRSDKKVLAAAKAYADQKFNSQRLMHGKY